ncbi:MULTISPECIES: aldo/keto reductase [Haloferax]|uniref:2,5-diketo-D-gluconic acid reductase B n=1 Tax=Haloferax massiliensis TaxID=1476858 RepID=A0A0D6JVM2_9EURY|nr:MULTISPECIES: aldo/keto reductase [Haloferax]MDS0243260.1 aldo/keto reductase [Haloferax sp. S2CR25]MDS0446381.1 aldo/keto reductase [Haloferax sp. S2CR25-2]CQR52434.1 2,5-diketo-D-gluconic acid reductase B [Haloferax massiliensis]
MSLPQLGLGTWQNTDPETCRESVRTALEMGYRHVDTAQYYGNEAAVGDGIEAADVPREEIFVASKVHAEKFGLAYDEVIEGLAATLDRLGLEYLDLLYVHWPVGNYDSAETLPAFDELVGRGRINHVGVCNFDIDLLEEAIEQLETPLFAHQVETHPLLQQGDLIAHAETRGYRHVAYSPLARGTVFDIPEVVEIADKHGVSPAQVSLAWLLSKNPVSVIPKATSEPHLRDNVDALSLDLDDRDIERIDAIGRTDRLVEREGAPWLDD